VIEAEDSAEANPKCSLSVAILNNEQLKDARMMRHSVKLKAFAFTGLILTGFTTFVQLNRSRFNK
jgi:hypothetical protein